jgi:hypothetical protein
MMFSFAVSFTTAVFAQTSSGMLTSNIETQYVALRSAIERVDPFYSKPRSPPLVKGKYSLAYNVCNGGFFNYFYKGDEKHEDDELSDILMWVAKVALGARADLKQLGYPPSVWLGDLEAYEASEVEFIHTLQSTNALSTYSYMIALRRWRQAAVRIGSTLKEYHEAHRYLTDIDPEWRECPSPLVTKFSVSIATAPAGAQVLFITAFFYELCKAQNLDPEDTRTCNRWREAHEGRLSEVIGDYWYIARWADATTRKGQLTFSDADNDTTITLRKP